jgi:hypothetical protein
MPAELAKSWRMCFWRTFKKKFKIYVGHKKQLENVHLGNVKKYYNQEKEKKQLKSVYIRGHKKILRIRILGTG